MPALPPQPLSPLDGRYAGVTAPLAEHLSEAALNRARLRVEVEWLLALVATGQFGVEPPSDTAATALRATVRDFGQPQIDRLATLEAATRHDVKAVELLLRERLAELDLARLTELAHFAMTSEDVNNLAVALTVRDALHGVWLPAFDAVRARIGTLALQWAEVPLLARTHGQPATPTTMGKELAVFAHRLHRVRDRITGVRIQGKSNGASGTYAAHVVAAPQVDWPAFSERFVTGLGLAWNPLTTQIESHDWQVELYGAISHANGVLHNLCTDAWTYISQGVWRQVPVEGATGSSTMPHKVNPIRFENAEANLELSTGILGTLERTLVTSRLQRDLTDSTTQRNIGVGFGHSLVALDNLLRGLFEIDPDREVLAADLAANWEVLAEAIQTVLRAEIVAGRSTVTDPYDALKQLTRGRRVTPESLAAFIDGLDLGDSARARLRGLTPSSYTGLAADLARHSD
ncbi:adenylosuccinate lyase [uncultured Amnibacterium sp.]|uniref:adenylosuccinate lyase n=1 Tax=uncultured Amnibacterium sp. TaxID=1631851 RepID=UPI0035CB4DD1